MTALASKSRFGYQMLLSMGWSEGKGLGKEQQGMAEVIKVEVRKDGQGLGTEEKEKQASTFVPWTVHKDSFNDLLKKLAKSVPAAAPPAEEEVEEKDDAEEERRRRKEERKRKRQQESEAQQEAGSEDTAHAGGLAGSSTDISREEKRRRKEQRREERARALEGDE
eukprot:TRINITY_DN719_c0_g1_i1.p3 TRINITY_DN719_c0_g1~~TRINITY_DN719_c0_g1_i1.p3  ORF type:complete len:187 (-),score=62.99 TRINITY_DN719_c0_g1_i1:318-815(-)